MLLPIQKHNRIKRLRQIWIPLRAQINFPSCGAASEGSPRRKPWEKGYKGRAPAGRKTIAVPKTTVKTPAAELEIHAAPPRAVATNPNKE